MKNKSLLLILVFTFFYLQFNYAQSSSNKVRVFKNNDFTFTYPKKWRELKTKDRNHNEIIVIAPKYSIREGYVLPKGVLVDKNNSKNLEKYVNNTKNLKEFSKNQFDVFIEQNNFKNLNDYILDRKKVIVNQNKKKNIHIISDIVKLSDIHYVEISKVNMDPSKQNFTIHYHLHANKIYILTFSFESKKIKKYKIDKEIILNSFQFKN